MSRWADVITLLSATDSYQDEEGGWHEGERVERTVFCNNAIVGTMAMAQLRSSEVRVTNTNDPVDMGLMETAMVYVMTMDYMGEDQCIYHDKEMQVIAATNDGENTKLFLRRRVGND